MSSPLRFCGATHRIVSRTGVQGGEVQTSPPSLSICSLRDLSQGAAWCNTVQCSRTHSRPVHFCAVSCSTGRQVLATCRFFVCVIYSEIHVPRSDVQKSTVGWGFALFCAASSSIGQESCWRNFPATFLFFPVPYISAQFRIVRSGFVRCC